MPALTIGRALERIEAVSRNENGVAAKRHVRREILVDLTSEEVLSDHCRGKQCRVEIDEQRRRLIG
jgi:hypothetical protein